MTENEFDKFAVEYEQMLKESTKSFGEEISYFAEYKVERLFELSARHRLSTSQILDFGSGIGNSIPFFRKYFPNSRLICADVSKRSLEISKSRFDGGEVYSLIVEKSIGLADNSIDLVFSTCVFHHIPAEEHDLWLRELYRILKPGGMIVIFEHNPNNPFTRRTVNQCPFDENAVLIKSKKFLTKLRLNNFNKVKANYTLFFPNLLASLRPTEKFLVGLPLGAQYFVYGFK